MDEQIVGIQGWRRKGIPPKKNLIIFLLSLIQLYLLENPAIRHLHRSCLKENGKFFKKEWSTITGW